MKSKANKIQQLQTQWENAIERAAEESQQKLKLGDMLNDSAGLHIKSGVQAGGLWGTTTSCTCNQCVS